MSYPGNTYCYCFVPGCKNTAYTTPDKLFFCVPKGDIRRDWCSAVGRDPDTLSLISRHKCCQDHFTLEKDVNNWFYYKTLMDVGQVPVLRLKKDALPRKSKDDIDKTEESNKKDKFDKLSASNNEGTQSSVSQIADAQGLDLRTADTTCSDSSTPDTSIALFRIKTEDLDGTACEEPQDPLDLSAFTDFLNTSKLIGPINIPVANGPLVQIGPNKEFSSKGVRRKRSKQTQVTIRPITATVACQTIPVIITAIPETTPENDDEEPPQELNVQIEESSSEVKRTNKRKRARLKEKSEETGFEDTMGSHSIFGVLLQT